MRQKDCKECKTKKRMQSWNRRQKWRRKDEIFLSGRKLVANCVLYSLYSLMLLVMMIKVMTTVALVTVMQIVYLGIYIAPFKNFS